jgi:hypothetical protein
MDSYARSDTATREDQNKRSLVMEKGCGLFQGKGIGQNLENIRIHCKIGFFQEPDVYAGILPVLQIQC